LVELCSVFLVLIVNFNQMKKYLLFGAFALMISGFASGASVTIINSGFTFSPNDVTINAGDTIKFELASIHNALEVNEATWNANGNTPLLGGFNTPFGQSELTGLSAGVHYYVCSVHFAMGMKGKITVNESSGIVENEPGMKKFNIFPNPTDGKFTLQFNGLDGKTGSWNRSTPHTTVEMYNILGEKVADLSDLITSSSNEINMSSVPDGIYFIRMDDNNTIYTEKLIKR
jgi:plastocyanin